MATETPAEAQPQLSSEERILIKEFARRRIFIFFYVIVVIAFVAVVAGGEEDLGPIDDYAKVIISLVMVVLIAATWKNQTLPSIKRTNRIATIAGLLILLFGILAVAVEINNGSDVGDDFPALILGVFLIINGVA